MSKYTSLAILLYVCLFFTQPVYSAQKDVSGVWGIKSDGEAYYGNHMIIKQSGNNVEIKGSDWNGTGFFDGKFFRHSYKRIDGVVGEAYFELDEKNGTLKGREFLEGKTYNYTGYKINERELFSGNHRSCDCGKYDVELVNLNREEAKTLLYIVENKIAKYGESCIYHLEAKDKVKLRGQTVIKWSALALFPNGYKVECFQDNSIEKRGIPGFTQMTLGGCNDITYFVEGGGLGPVFPGEYRIFIGDDQI